MEPSGSSAHVRVVHSVLQPLDENEQGTFIILGSSGCMCHHQHKAEQQQPVVDGSDGQGTCLFIFLLNFPETEKHGDDSVTHYTSTPAGLLSSSASIIMVLVVLLV